MKILIDARMYGLEHAGIGRYVMELISHLQKIDKVNEYLILSLKNQNSKIKIQKSKFKIIETNARHYTLSEQLELPKIFNQLDFDIAHFPHFNVPIFFRKPYVVTIHDLIKHTSRGMTTTTRDPMLYWIKYAGYKVVFGSAVRRARKIIVPSNAVKEDLLSNYDILEDKVQVIYEGVDEVFKRQVTSNKSQEILKKYNIKTPYIIYAGSAYPHKNLERLISAYHILIYDHPGLHLVICSARNVFLERLRVVVKQYGLEKRVHFLGFVEDSELAQLYRSARALVFSSLSEGFGLPGLEAMAAGCPVVCSDIPVFHEIYGDAATYFDPHDIRDIVQKISEVINSNDSNHQSMVARGKERAKQFSWRKMAEETLKVYNEFV